MELRNWWQSYVRRVAFVVRADGSASIGHDEVDAVRDRGQHDREADTGGRDPHQAPG